MGAGDILSSIAEEGWIDLTIEGLNVGGTYDLGWTAYIPGALTSGVFIAGETITQAATGATAIIAPGAGTRAFGGEVGLRILEAGQTGSPNGSGVWTGGTSGATWTPTDIYWAVHIPEDSDPKVILTATSLGFDATGAVTTRARTLYGTIRQRVPSTTKQIAGSYTSGTFEEGEVITQTTSGATAIVAIGGSAGPTLWAHTVAGTPNNSDTWTGSDSSATFAPSATPAAHGTDAVPGPREFFDGTNTIIRIWLSDYIYAKDKTGAGNSGTDVAHVILSGVYAQGGTPTAGNSGTTTNNSTLAYQKVVGNWAWPGYELIPAAGLAARAVVFHRHAMNGKPVACVIFEDSEGANSESVTVSTPTIDSTMPDAVPVIEYVGTPPVTSLTQAAVVTRNFRAYPWVGDTGAILDTSAGTAAPTPLYGPQKLLCDKAGTFPKTYARVSTTGSDAGANTVYDSAAYNPATAYEFATIGKAASAIAAFNNTTYGRNDVGAAVVHLDAGTYAWLGSSNAYGNVPNVWITIKPNTGVARADAIIGSGVSNTDISDRVKLQNLTITSTTLNTFSNINAFWLDNCAINTTGTGIFNTSTTQVLWVTHGIIPQLTQGLRGGTQAVCPALVRGVDFTGFKRSILTYTAIGNLKETRYTPEASLFITEISGSSAPQSINFIIAFNKILGFETSAGFYMVQVGRFGGANTHGGAIVQNIFENCNGTGALATLNSSDDVNTNTPLDNLIVWHNVWLGQRNFIGYNDAGNLLKQRRYWHVANNYWDREGNKGDNFTPVNAIRVGAWTITNGVGWTGNVLAQNQQSIPGSFYHEFPGIKTHQPNVNTSQVIGWEQFTDRQAYAGTGAASNGDGVYTTQSTSPLRDMGLVLVLPYDIAGGARTTENNDAGAYASNYAPIITDQPDSANKNEGESVTFTVVADGLPAPTYQWRKDGVNIPGETGSSLTINDLTSADSGDYDVVVTNSEGSVTSDAATLSVEGSSAAGCDVQTLLTAGRCFTTLSPHMLEAVKVQLWCNIAGAL